MGEVGHYFGSGKEELKGGILHILKVEQTKEKCQPALSPGNPGLRSHIQGGELSV